MGPLRLAFAIEAPSRGEAVRNINPCMQNTREVRLMSIRVGVGGAKFYRGEPIKGEEKNGGA